MILGPDGGENDQFQSIAYRELKNTKKKMALLHYLQVKKGIELYPFELPNCNKMRCSRGLTPDQVQRRYSVEKTRRHSELLQHLSLRADGWPLRGSALVGVRCDGDDGAVVASLMCACR